MKTITILLTVLTIMTITLPAQPKVYNVWNGKIPGAKEMNGFKEDTIKVGNGLVRIARVINPTISVYFPKENPTGTAAIICPGGGYNRLAMDNEGSDIAAWLNANGITAIVLKYRLPNDTIMENKTIGPLQDVQEAIRMTRRSAKEWNLNPHKIGVFGFSAGGHLASTVSTHFNEKVYDSDSTSARPDFAVLVYPVITMNEKYTHAGSRLFILGKNPDAQKVEYYSNELRVTKETPPTFMVHAEDDKTVPVQNSIDYYTALKNNNIPAELHIYQKGGHGFSLAKDKGTASQWPFACIQWLKQMGLAK
jgi:acetyl esterase/lipase